VITITGIGDHLRPEWPITFTGMRTKCRLTIEEARNEPNLLLKQALAGLAFDIAQHAEVDERCANRREQALS
jgi:hypothetical protein